MIKTFLSLKLRDVGTEFHTLAGNEKTYPVSKRESRKIIDSSWCRLGWDILVPWRVAMQARQNILPIGRLVEMVGKLESVCVFWKVVFAWVGP